MAAITHDATSMPDHMRRLALTHLPSTHPPAAGFCPQQSAACRKCVTLPHALPRAPQQQLLRRPAARQHQGCAAAAAGCPCSCCWHSPAGRCLLTCAWPLGRRCARAAAGWRCGCCWAGCHHPIRLASCRVRRQPACCRTQGMQGSSKTSCDATVNARGGALVLLEAPVAACLWVRACQHSQLPQCGGAGRCRSSTAWPWQRCTPAASQAGTAAGRALCVRETCAGIRSVLLFGGRDEPAAAHQQHGLASF